jgi:nucleoside-diphosphate-sugar epimerase
MSNPAQPLALVIGAAGGVGGEAATALVRHGWRVRALTRRSQPARDGIEWMAGDALDADDVARAARGARLIVHAANPPGYSDWDTLVLPMLDNTIAAAKAEGARILLPGTLYNYGPDAFPRLDEGSPQNPTSRKGAIRVEMERRLKAASQAGAKALIIRAGDFYGPRPGNNWFSQGMIKPGAPLKAVTEPAARGTTHAWAYLPDLGETMAQLMDREDQLADFEVFHFAGHALAHGEMAAAIRAATGQPRLPVRAFPWALVVALAPVVRLFGEMAEVRVLWRRTVVLDDRKLRAFLGHDLPRTPLLAAVTDSLAGLGCLPRPIEGTSVPSIAIKAAT